MLAIELQQRVFENKDWATLLFILSFAIIALNKSMSPVRFSEFIRLAISNKYTKLYRDSSHFENGFTFSMFFLQLLSYSFFVFLVLNQVKKTEKEDLILYIQIFTFLSVFFISKLLIDKIIATAFKIEEFSEQFNLIKIHYRTYIGFILVPINVIFFYNSFEFNWLYWTLLIVILLFNIGTYLITLKLYQNLILRKLFYFILYLCTLEIAPYYFIYNWFTIN